MAITTDDFNKIWASTSPLTPYSFSASQYKEGWNFIGGTPPSRQMWDFLQKNNDEKMQYLLNNFDNYLPLSGGTLTGVVNGVTPTAGDNSTKIATTEFVNAKAGNYLPLAGGNITGSLTVSGKDVERVNASGSNYIRYESGIQICWDYANTPSNGVFTVTFPVAFININYSMNVTGSPASTGTASSRITSLSGASGDKTTTSWKGTIVSASNVLVGTSVVYIAIGKWK